MVERSIAWLVRGSRRLRYRGTDRNGLWPGHRAAAVNLIPYAGLACQAMRCRVRRVDVLTRSRSLVDDASRGRSPR